MYSLKSEFQIPLSKAQIFPFFGDARNLERLTPGWLRFQVLTPGEIEMAVGTRIDYRLTLRGVPIRWQSEITAWNPPEYFVDEQIKGPYRAWVHRHEFEEVRGITQVRDEVRYDHWGGTWVNRLLVAPDLDKIFRFRRQALKLIFGENLVVSQ